MAPVVRALRETPWVDCTVALTAQHRELLDRALGVFDVRADIDLDLMRPNQTLGEITGRVFLSLDPVIRDLKPDLVLAQGDTTTVMVAAMTSFYNNVKFGHVEAGLRTGDLRNPFPEEMNRVFAGRIADFHFAPTPLAGDTLRGEGVDPARVIVTGNTVIDALLFARDRAPRLDLDLPPGARLLLFTAHRRENFGAPMEAAFRAVCDLVDARPELHVLFPVHPNPNVRELASRIFSGRSRVHLREPMDYLEFTAAMSAADVIVTDSGGVQEEAPALGKPVLVMRRETERPEAVKYGVVKLLGSDGDAIRLWVNRLLDDSGAYDEMARGVSPYGDGLASRRIVQAIAAAFGQSSDGAALADFDPDIAFGARSGR